MTVRHLIQTIGVTLSITLIYLLLPLPVQAEEPGWRQVSSGLEGGTIVDLAISPDFAVDGLLFAVIDKDGSGQDSKHNDGDRLFRLTKGVWTPVYDALVGRTVQQVTFSPNYKIDKKIFVATNSDGLFVSQDAGKTWTQINAASASFWTLQASPGYASDELIYAGGNKGLFRMKNDGSNRVQLANGLLLTDTVRSLTFSPDFGTDSTIFVGTTNSGVVRSINGGATWDSVGLAGLWVNALAFADDGASTTLFAGTGKGLYRSLDNGNSWESVGTDLDFFESLAVSPDFANDEHLYAGARGGFRRSVDGGANWTFINDPRLPRGVLSIALHPDYIASNAVMFVGQNEFLGVARSDDGGSQWELLNDGLTALSVDELSIWSNLADQTLLFAGAYPIGLYRSDDRGASWQANSGAGLPKPVRLQAMAVSPQFDTDRTLFFSSQYDGIFRSIDGGANWQPINDDSSWPHNSTEAKQLAISPAFHRDGVLFAGIDKRGIYRLAKNQPGWERVYEPGPGIEIMSMAISPQYADDSTIFAGVGEQILYSTNGGDTDTWKSVQNAPSTERYSVLAVPPNFGQNGDTTFFAVQRYSNTIYRFRDGGAVWSALRNKFPADSEIRALIFSPNFGTTDSKLYAGLDVGIYVSEDGGDSWQALSGGVPVWDVLALLVSQGLTPKLYAGIDGGSVVQYNITQPSYNLSCGDTVTSSITLDRDMQCSETALIVNASADATVDCAGHILIGSYPAVTSGFGIQVIGSTSVTIRNCKIYNFKTGVAFQGSSGNTLINNELHANAIGVWMTSLARADDEQMSTDNTVTNNLFRLNNAGLLLSAGADRNRLVGNTIQSSVNVGIDINNTRHTLITGNSIYGSGALGISILKSDSMTLTANSVLSHTVAVSVSGNGGLFTGNTWRNNGTGVVLEGTSANNLLYNNHFSNPVNVTFGPSVGLNIWNVAQRSGPNIIGGSLIAGNFWGGPSNSGFSQICADAPPDGLCDLPNPLGGSHQDQLPLAALAGLADCTSGPQWAILIYLNGDNDLDFWTVQLFNRLEQVAVNPCLRIVVLWDRDQIGDSNLYWVQGDDNPFGLAAYVEDVNFWPSGELDMGNPQTLVNFVNWARSRFEASYTMLSIVGHGNGWSPSSTATPRSYFHTGISFDDSGGGTSLSTNNLGAALGTISQNGADPIDLLYLDACLMAMAETLHPLQNFASYVVASENESFTSYPYDRYLGAVSSTTTPASLADRIVTEHHQSLQGYPRTLAAFDLSRMDEVTNAIDQLARSLLDAYAENEQNLRTDVLTIFADVQKLDSNVDLLVDEKDGYVDLLHFARLVDERMGNAAIRAAAQSLQNALSGTPNPLIVNSQAESGVYGGTSWNLANATGLSIYLPLGQEDWRVDFYNENELSLAEVTQWDEFVQTLAAFDDATRPSPLTTAYPPSPLKVDAHALYLPNLNR